MQDLGLRGATDAVLARAASEEMLALGARAIL
jgi:hypothetical protein